METFRQKRWDLSDILSSHKGKPFEDFISSLESKVKEFELLRPGLDTLDKQGLEKAIALNEDIVAGMIRLDTYAGLLFAADTQSEEAKSFMQKADRINTAIGNRLKFFELWLGSVDETKLQEVMPTNQDYRTYINNIRLMNKYKLDEKAEQVASIKDISGSHAWKELYDTTTNSFTFSLKPDGRTTIKDEKGKTKRFIAEELMHMKTGSDPKERRLAYRAMLGKYGTEGRLLFDIYSNIARDFDSEAEIRGFPTPISARNAINSIGDEAVDALLLACRKNNSIFQRLFKIKARLLGVDKMSRYDLYAPIERPDKKIGYPEAVALVLDTFSRFDKRFSDLARLAFEKDHVDSEIRPGKQSGAFCSSWSADQPPYLKLNYNDDLEGVFQIAHESGHAVHSLLAAAHPFLSADTGTPHNSGLPLAETASIFGEMILTDRLFASMDYVKLKQGLLFRELDSAYAGISRQAYFVIFEKEAHEALKKGATAKDLCGIYRRGLEEMFGDSMDIPQEFQWEWAYIPHIFHTPFYCYAYSFGSLLTYAMYDRYRKNPEKTREEMEKLLSYGGSKTPSEMLSEIGIDIKSEAFWQSGFDVLKSRVEELEKLV